jgi:hypothetical protein
VEDEAPWESAISVGYPPAVALDEAPVESAIAVEYHSAFAVAFVFAFA